MTNACAYMGVGISLIYLNGYFLQPQTRIGGPRFFRVCLVCVRNTCSQMSAMLLSLYELWQKKSNSATRR